MTFKVTTRGGEYYRVADPNWEDPLDGAFSMRIGGRWNSPGAFPVTYLNRDIATARANVRKRFSDFPYSPEELDPSEAPILLETVVNETEFVDIVSDEGCNEAGLPQTYPSKNGELVSWETCQPIGQRVWDEGANGLACRSAAGDSQSGYEELAWFQRDERLTVSSIEEFEDWFWPR